MVEEMGPSERLYGMLQFLMMHNAAAEPPVPAEPRNVVELQDALDAVMQIAAVIDENTQNGRIPAERGVHAGAMLMLVRDYLQPLPPAGEGTDVRDPCAADLEVLVTALRAWRSPDEVPHDWA